MAQLFYVILEHILITNNLKKIMFDELENFDHFVLDDDKNNSTITQTTLNHFQTISVLLRFFGFLSVLGAIGYFIQYFITTFNYLGIGFYLGIKFYIGVLITLAFLGAVVYSGVLLIQAGNYMNRYVTQGKSFDLEEAFEKQKVYWTTMSLLFLFGGVIALYSYVTLPN